MTDDLDDDDEPLWNCGCGMLVDGTLHCPACGACAPWGCGSDHEDEDDPDDFEAEPWEQGLYEREMQDALGPPLNDHDDD